MNKDEKIKNILRNAIDIERWATKNNTSYSFLDEDEKEEMIESILTNLKNKGYTIIKNRR